MNKENKGALIAIPIIILLGIGLVFAGSQNSVEYMGLPVFALGVGVAFLIQWIVFIFAYGFQTEKFFDLTGSITYILVIVGALIFSEKSDIRSILLTGLVVVWAARLGSFLFLRIRKAGEDRRFREIKKSFPRFLTTWTLQGLWVSLTLAAALATLTSSKQVSFDIFLIVGLLVWLFGFVIEVVSDQQKSKFKADEKNNGKFINVGLWSWSRHPNYFGEIVLWIGIAIISLPVLQGWQWLMLISPVFVTLLLTKVSGVPMLEDRADQKWGGQEDYEQYKKQTSVLIPFPPKKEE